MNAIILHPLGFQIDLFHEKWQQRNIKLFGKLRIDRAKRLIIPTAVVSGQANLHQQRLGVGGLNGLQNGPQRLLCLLRLEAAQTIIAAEFDQHPTRLMLLKQGRQARQALLRRIAADTAVNDSRPGLPFIIEQGGPGRTSGHTIARAQAVAQNQ